MTTTTIQDQLASLERDRGVRILYACESGSHAWGFASPDSGYDVRFIYAQPRDSYLAIYQPPDTIELPAGAGLHIDGWDIRKALQLFARSNSTVYEWLQSPIVYREEGDFARKLRGLMQTYYSHRSGCHHYLSMAYNALSEDLHSDEIKLKKYFHALRPALACAWILEKKAVPPMDFATLRTLVHDPAWNADVDQLLRQKRAAGENTYIPRVPLLQDWLAATLTEYKQKADAIPSMRQDTRQLDELFRQYIQ
jgi:predicted nucleotidyltransferase